MPTSLAREYSRAVRNQTQWWGTFPLGLPMAVGDIIQLEDDGRLIKVGSALDRPGWRDALPVESTDLRTGERWSWHATTSRAASAEGGVTALGGAAEVSATASVSFTSVGAFILAYIAGKHHMFRNVDNARRWVLGAARVGDWEDRYALVTEVLEADPATMLVSSETSTTFQLRAKAGLPFDPAGVGIADPKLGLSGETTEGSVLEVVATRCFPLYHCVRVRRNLVRRIHAELSATEQFDLVDVFDDSPFDDTDG